jgi:hypothetical protein
MSNLSTFYKPAITRADLGLGTANNVTFASIQNTPIGSTTASTVAATNLSASGTVSGTGFSNYLAAPPAIGNTTPAAGTFTTLTANNGTLTASAPVLDLAQTWNNAAVTFTGLRFNVTNTASAATSDLVDIQIGGTTQLRLRGSQLFVGPFTNSGIYSPAPAYIGSTAGLLCATQLSIGNNLDTILIRDGASGVLAQRNGAVAQTFNIYNTFTSATNHERGFLRWSSNVFQIGTEAAGTGSNRNLEIRVGASTYTFSTVNSIITNGSYIAGSTGFYYWFNRGRMGASANGVFSFEVNAGGDFGRLCFGGTTSSFPALKRSSTELQVRLADDSAFAGFSCGALTLNGNLDASTRDIVTDTTTGTKIGTGTTQKIGFFNATPVVQQAAVADATDAASTQDRLNDLLARLRTLGLIAT